ncbi:HSP90B1 [Bugula neritina]|uniref:HSP90B1 n=1 Tax=Bugula neritina TaxID=10212 RepID=A0A7J7KC59_BUGNE|nr:HSP90B1 [Bugula neritina]
MGKKVLLVALLGCLILFGTGFADDSADSGDVDATEDAVVEDDLGKSREGSRTDDEVVAREEEAIKLDGMSVAEMKALRDSSEKHDFQAEVDRMMKLIINSLYKNKEIFLRELISNASDALDKIRFLSLTDKDALSAVQDLTIKIKSDKDNNLLHITDTGIGMTKEDLVRNLGTIAKSGTSEFFSKLKDSSSNEASDLIGQFGVGFYSAFLVADKVVVTSKHNDDDQYVWESDAASFSVGKDPRGDTLKRGTQITLHLKEEAAEYLQPNTIKDLVTKYSQFINFNIYLWESKKETVEEPVDEDEEESADKEEKAESEDDEAEVSEEKEEDKPKTKSVEKTVWDWVLVNGNKPIWTRKSSEVEDEEYNEFYKSFSRDSEGPMTKVHFTAEGEVTFKSILFIPKTSPVDWQNQSKNKDRIKMYVRRVFITDDFDDMMPKYLSFVRGIVDSDDLPLNVSRETLQQHKLLKVIKKKLVRKTLDMIKKISEEDYEKFWKEYSTNIKLGVIEDHANRTRLSKLLRFKSSNDEEKMTSLADYVSRMKDSQEHIYFMAAGSLKEVTSSPFVERLLKKGYENVAKEGLNIDGEVGKEKMEVLNKEFEPLTAWLKEKALADLIDKATVSARLTTSPCALVASSYG